MLLIGAALVLPDDLRETFPIGAPTGNTQDTFEQKALRALLLQRFPPLT